jgi:hypothetical protein
MLIVSAGKYTDLPIFNPKAGGWVNELYSLLE